MQAASSPSRWTCGFSIVVFTALQFLPSTAKQKKKKSNNTVINFILIEDFRFYLDTGKILLSIQQFDTNYEGD